MIIAYAIRLSDVLSNTQWNDLTDIQDANAYDTFHDKFNQIYTSDN